MSGNQPSSNRPHSRQGWQQLSGPQSSSRPHQHRSNTVEFALIGHHHHVEPLLVPAGVELTVVMAPGGGGQWRGPPGGRGRGGRGSGGEGGAGRGRGREGDPQRARQMRIDEMFPSKVADRINEAQGGDGGRQAGALNARSSWDGGARPSSDTDDRRRLQRGGGGGGGRESPTWQDDRRGSPRMQDAGDRPSHNRLDEATLSPDPLRAKRAEVANETLNILYEESYRTPDGSAYNIRQAKRDLAKGTRFYSENKLTNWRPRPPLPLDSTTKVEFIEHSTIAAARYHAAKKGNEGKVGVLNFASATKRGGGFKNGAEAQEESLARASTLYFSLCQPDAKRFYDTHIGFDNKGYYSHSMIYSRGVTIIRDEDDRFVDPMTVNIVTSAAVNAGSVRRKAGKRRPEDVEAEIYNVMFERMGRILKCFEENGDKVLVLGSFGTGVFQNQIEMVAAIWAHLLGPGGAFCQSFDRVEFAILGRPTFEKFEKAYNYQSSSQLAKHLAAQERARP